MYIDRLFTFLTHLYHAYTPYAIGAMVVILILFFFKTKAMAKLTAFLFALIVVIYVAGLFMDGVSNSSNKKKTLTEKSRQYEQ